MINEHITIEINAADKIFQKIEGILRPNETEPLHYYDISVNPYYKALLVLRHYIKVTSNYYFSDVCNATDIDLFMITQSISSPLGHGSNSTALPVKFGRYNAFLTDSAQFGFEPLLVKNFEKVFCYMPSLRGENPDSRHLNQFFHCEFEMVGTLENVIEIAEQYFKTICKSLILMNNIIEKISVSPVLTKKILQETIIQKKFLQITFDEAIEILEKNGFNKNIRKDKIGRCIDPDGEIILAHLLNQKVPFWITGFERDMSPFYQKPDPLKKNRVINADLIVPPIVEGSFGGEVLGAGQRQDNVSEMLISLKRQNIKSESYDWYINLRKITGYKNTSGFGLGIERFVTWALGYKNIKDVIIYPRLKNQRSYP